MKEINVSQLADNMIEAIGKEWMLVTAGTKDSDTVIPRRGKQSYT